MKREQGTTARGVLGGLLALALVATSGATSASTAADASDVSVTNVTNEDMIFTDDEAGGCQISTHVWELCMYFQHGADPVARVEPDHTDPIHHDGSLRIATPEEGDEVNLFYGLDGRRVQGPRFGDVHSAGYALNVVAGEPVRYRWGISCPGPVGLGMGLTFAGPFADGPGWQVLDVVQGGQAL